MWENDYFNIYSCSPRTLFRYIKELNEAQTVYRFHHEKKAKLFYAEVLQAPQAEPAQDSRLARLLKIINKYTKNSFYLNESSRRDFLPPLTPPYVPFGIRRFSSQSHIISTLLLILI